MSFTSDQLDWLNRELRAIHDRIDQALGLVPVDPHLVELARQHDSPAQPIPADAIAEQVAQQQSAANETNVVPPYGTPITEPSAA